MPGQIATANKNKQKKKMGEEDFGVVWNVDLEVSLFHAMRKHKPVGKFYGLLSVIVL